MAAPKRTPSAEEVAYKAQSDADFVSGAASSGLGRVTEVEEVKGNDTSAYIGVSPEYMNYSSDILKPLAATEGVDKIREDRYRAAVQTKVAKAPAPAEDTSTQGVSTYETVATATSGSDLSAELVDAPKLETVTHVNKKPVEPTATPTAEESSEPSSTPSAPTTPTQPQPGK